ncbi:DUF4340 domain-containing protein [Pelagicoccus albus]|uniref:DUF4340 domain-containing protein n=1 Tax=Pelagicoccus albus TaxID=415222 RepID=A0A7X1B559_9BACT|nr:DUF4340 domain-containing protein [Pelagicoccus albus]MBC2604590.1 DUF4340 domain-containing protein [Pelagicoccus albus]
MNLKKLYLSTAILAVLAFITYFLKNNDSPKVQDQRVGSPILANAQLDKVSTLEMISGSESMTFIRQDGNWLLQERYQLPADPKQIANLIKQLKDTTLERVASKNPERISDFGFGIDYINLLAEDGASVLSLDLGRETESGKQLVRFGEEEIAFVASEAFGVNGDPVSWLKKSLVSLDRDQIRTLKVSLLDGSSLELSRESEDEDWMATSELPEGMTLDQAAIDRAIGRVSQLNFVNLAELDDPEVLAAAANQVSVTLTMSDETNYTFEIGRRPEVRVEKQVETTNEDGEKISEKQEEVETPAGPVYVKIESSKADDPLNKYMDQTAFATTSTLFTAFPESIEGFLKKAPSDSEEPGEEE